MPTINESKFKNEVARSWRADDMAKKCSVVEDGSNFGTLFSSSHHINTFNGIRRSYGEDLNETRLHMPPHKANWDFWRVTRQAPAWLAKSARR
jgi:hypothetical protein